jgi:hypothetical protein
MTPSATSDFPLPGSIPAMYRLCAIGFSFHGFRFSRAGKYQKMTERSDLHKYWIFNSGLSGLGVT